jgi:hypothetical protein
MEFRYPNASSSGVALITPDIINVTHIPNTNVTTKPYNLRLSHFYLELFSLYLYTINRISNPGTNLQIPDFPPLTISRKYHDIGEKNLQKCSV